MRSFAEGVLPMESTAPQPRKRPYRFRGWDWTELASCWGYRRPRRATHHCRECDQDVPLRAPDLCARCGMHGDDRAVRDCVLARLNAAMERIERREEPDATVADLRRFLFALAQVESPGGGCGYDRGYAPLWRAMARMPDEWHLCQAAAVLLRRMWT